MKEGNLMAKRYPDSRPYPYNTDRGQWVAFWIALAVIAVAIIISWSM